MKVLAIIQARLGSSRMRGKVLAEIAGQPMLWHQWNRASQAQRVNEVIVATGDPGANQPLIDMCKSRGVGCFAGSEDDVLGRIHGAASHFGADIVMNLWGDCPLVDPEILDRVVEEFQRYQPDLCATSPSYTFPDGFGCEVLSFATLDRLEKEAVSPLEREHATIGIRRNRDKYRVRFIENESFHPFTDLHLSVDEESDFDLVRTIFEALLPEKPIFHLRDVCEYLQRNPQVLAAHPSPPINEGYFKTLLRAADRPHLPGPPLKLDRSMALLERAAKVIPSCTQTFSKGYTQYVQGASPVFVERGKGALVYDVDGNEYIDYPLALGAISVGHAYPEIDEAAIRQLAHGPSHSLPHRLEVELAERLCEIIPCAEMVRFGKNGSDATAGAVRLARAVTVRDMILACGYHGWHDWYIGTTLRRKGVPLSTQQMTATFSYGDIADLEKKLSENSGKVAAVIMEALGTTMPPPDYLAQVKEVVHRHGALLVFDEIVAGFRLALGGAQQYFGVTPDLACFGKGMANGFPISAIVGPRSLMSELDNSFYSFTFGGETVSLAAALATIEVMERENAISQMWILGRKIKDAYNYLSSSHGLASITWSQGFPPRTVNMFKDTAGQDSQLFRSIFQQECVRRGVLFNGAPKICLQHTDRQIEHTIYVYDEAFQVLKKAVESAKPEQYLQGKPTQPVFRKSDY